MRILNPKNHRHFKEIEFTQKTTKEEPVFRFSPRSRNIKQNLENLFKHLNSLEEITSKEGYREALKLFNVEIKKSGRGHIVLVTDGEGNSIRYPIRLSNFKERPGFYQSQKELSKNKNIDLKEYHNQKNQDAILSYSLIRNLVKLIPRDYSKERNQKLRIKRRKRGKQWRF